MNLDFLDWDIKRKLLKYLKGPLSDDLSEFETFYGYQGNINLARWLIVINVFKKDIKEPVNYSDMLPNYQFLKSLREHNALLENHRIALYGLSEFIPILSPYIEIAYDGIGGKFYATFINDFDPILLWEHEEDAVYVQRYKLSDVIKSALGEKLYAELGPYLYQRKNDLGISTNNFGIDRNVFQKSSHFHQMMKGVYDNRPHSFFNQKLDEVFNPFETSKNKVNRIYNFIKSCYWLFFTGQLDALELLVEEKPTHKGKLVESVFNSFEALTKGNYKHVVVKHEELEKIRGVNALEGTGRYESERNSCESQMSDEDRNIKFLKKKYYHEIENKEPFLNIMYNLKGNDYIRQLLSNGQHISRLRVINNPFDSLPDEIADLELLEAIEWRSGLKSVSPMVGQLRLLKSFSPHYNELETLPIELGQLENLEQLSLSNNRFSTLPECVSSFSQLKSLDLSYNLLEEFPRQIYELKNLTYLRISNNKIPSIPKGISNLQNLTGVEFVNNKLEEIPLEVLELENLKSFSFFGNCLKEIPLALIEKEYMTGLSISNNLIEYIPEEITQIERITWMDIRNNPLKELPKGLLEMKNLKKVRMDYKQMEKFKPIVDALWEKGVRVDS